MLKVVGIDAHKKKCVAALLQDSGTETFEFPTTMQGLSSFYEKVPDGNTVVIEASTTGKVITKLLSGRYEVHMVAPPERKPSVKTDERDAVRIAKEDMLGYLRRVYVPDEFTESMRDLVMQQIQVGRKISRVKNQIHALLEKNMVHDLDDLSDPFGVEGLRRISELSLNEDDTSALRTYLEELKIHLMHHEQFETRLAKIVQSDQDVKLLLTIPGMNAFTAVAVKSRIGDASRFPTKKHLCSYAGLVPGADNTGEYVSRHNHVKHGDMVLKYALTCAVRGAVSANKPTTVKACYLKLLKRQGVAQKAEVGAARKLACVVWKILISKKPFVEEDRYLTVKKFKRLAFKAGKPVPDDTSNRSAVSQLVNDISCRADALARYPMNMESMFGKEDFLSKDGIGV